MTHTSAKSMIADLFVYNSWANKRLLDLSSELTDSTLDEPREIGLGTLRNTLFHLLAAEETWLDRWQSKPRRPFPLDAEGMAVQDIRDGLEAVNEARTQFLEAIGKEGLNRICHYQDSRGDAHSHRMQDLVVHVINHGIHHRAQAIHHLKRAGKRIRGGLDYIFYKFARPSVPQSADTAKTLNGFGLEVATGSSPPLEWSQELVCRYFDYGDWANGQFLEVLSRLTDDRLDHDYAMGVGSIRKTALHLYDAERFWLDNWNSLGSPWQNSPETISIKDLNQRWQELSERRNEFLRGLNEDQSRRIVEVNFGGPPILMPVGESALQLCSHGTHHRAQIRNMLRQCGESMRPLDFINFVREIPIKMEAKPVG